MKTKFVSLLIALSVTVLLIACGDSKKSAEGDSLPAITVKTQRVNDSSAFMMSNGERCTILSEASIDYPVASGNGTAIDTLQRLFAAYVLESGDTLSLQEAMRQVVSNSMHQYDFMSEPMSDAEKAEAADSDDLNTLRYATSTRVSPVYNKNGVVTFERVDVVKKNDKVTSVTHRYFSFDVESQTFIDLPQLFRDDAVADVCQLLRQQLLQQNNATGNEQLNDLGYFNVENITVTRNFYFDDNGVTWCFLPNELAVEAVGEPKITIAYKDLTNFLCDGSIIEKLK